MLRPHRLSLAVLAALVVPTAAFAQEVPADAQARTSTLDTLIVTGTRVTDRTVAESQSPIDIIGAEALQATGTTELATALARALPSLNFPRPALTDGTSGIRPAQLRGLSPDQVLIGGTWTIGGFEATANATRYGEFSVLGSNAALDQTFDAAWTLDLAFSYALDKWTFTVGGDNVLDQYPDEVLFANSTGGQLPWSGSSPFGFNGAFVYANVAYRW